MNENDYLEEDDEVEYYAIRPNKSQQKRDLAVLFAMGEEMSELSQSQLENLQLPENIYKAVLEVAKMPHKSARKRQLKYIAGQLNKIELEDIKEQLSRYQNQSVHAVREHHQAERWRDKLLGDDNSVLTEFLGSYPNADSQHIRQLQRNAKKELASEKPPKSSRLLYKYIKALITE